MAAGAVVVVHYSLYYSFDVTTSYQFLVPLICFPQRESLITNSPHRGSPEVPRRFSGAPCASGGKNEVLSGVRWPTKEGMADWFAGTVDFFAKLVVTDDAPRPATPLGSAWGDPSPPEYPVNSVGTALHQAVWTCQADAALRRHLNINNDDELRAAFKRADTNGDGELSHEEWAEAFGHAVEDTSCKSMLWRLFQDIDTDKNDKIDENEFVQGLHTVPPVSMRLRQLVVCSLPSFSCTCALCCPMMLASSCTRRTDCCWTRSTRRDRQHSTLQLHAGTSRRRDCS